MTDKRSKFVGKYVVLNKSGDVRTQAQCVGRQSGNAVVLVDVLVIPRVVGVSQVTVTPGVCSSNRSSLALMPPQPPAEAQTTNMARVNACAAFFFSSRRRHTR